MGRFFPYLGGKTALVPRLLELIPPHRVYVEVFGGSAELLFSKPRSQGEVYNDLNGELVNLFLVARDRHRELKGRLDMLPYSRLLYEKWKTEYRRGDVPGDDVERAARYYYLLCGSFAGKPWGGWAFDRRRVRGYWSNRRLRVIREVHRRLQGVAVEHKDFRDLIRLYDGPDAFFFLDPPYLETTGYGVGFGEAEHRALAEILIHAEGRWLLTVEEHPLMRELYAGCIVDEVGQSLNSEKIGLGGTRRRLSNLIVANYQPLQVCH